MLGHLAKPVRVGVIVSAGHASALLGGLEIGSFQLYKRAVVRKDMLKEGVTA